MPTAPGYSKPTPHNWLGKKVLITTDAWFYAPDGECYKAAHGTLVAVLNDQETLGIRSNARSTNWYVQVGNLLVAGCQIHYAILANNVSYEPKQLEGTHDGKAVYSPANISRIYNADAEPD